MTEQWLPVAGWEGLYEVSDLGRVRSLSQDYSDAAGRRRHTIGRVLSQRVDRRSGYHTVGLSRRGQQKTRLVHQLVLEAFLLESRNGRETRHLDGDPGHNNLFNLAWGTAQQNHDDKLRHNTTRYSLKRGSCINGHPWDEDSLHIRPNGTPHCRICRRANASARDKALRAARRLEASA